MILKQLLPVLIVVFLFSCNNESKPSKDKNEGSANKDSLGYPFAASYSLKWQPGDDAKRFIPTRSGWPYRLVRRYY